MRSEDSITIKTRWRYTEEFKVAVPLARYAATVAQVARNLGIADHLGYRWRAEQ
ncbi:MAG: hypothetical protein OJF51_003786 [Nitrospira sp.]|jgi:transposase-like protein|nr:MAG: hypothetical protein OJF51_003786 [Nitrospira sp.]